MFSGVGITVIKGVGLEIGLAINEISVDVAKALILGRGPGATESILNFIESFRRIDCQLPQTLMGSGT